MVQGSVNIGSFELAPRSGLFFGEWNFFSYKCPAGIPFRIFFHRGAVFAVERNYSKVNENRVNVCS